MRVKSKTPGRLDELVKNPLGQIRDVRQDLALEAVSSGDRIVGAFIDDPLELEDLLSDWYIVEEACVVDANDEPGNDGGPTPYCCGSSRTSQRG